MDKKKRITVKVDPAFHRKAKVKAAEENRSMSEVVRELLDQWVKSESGSSPNRA